MPGTAGVWGGWLSKKPFQKELAMHGLTFDPRQCRVLLLVIYISIGVIDAWYTGGNFVKVLLVLEASAAAYQHSWWKKVLSGCLRLACHGHVLICKTMSLTLYIRLFPQNILRKKTFTKLSKVYLRSECWSFFHQNYSDLATCK